MKAGMSEPLEQAVYPSWRPLAYRVTSMSEPAKSRPASRRMLADVVQEELMAALIDGRYQPDAQLTIDSLAREMDVSPTPIREALARLEATGLVRRTALKGYRVAPPPTPEDLAELSDARLVLEPVNAYRACQRTDDDLIERLREAVTDLANAPTVGSFSHYQRYWEADERFHEIIAEAAHNRFLLAAFHALGGQLQRFRLFGNLGVTDARHAVAEHGQVLAAFEGGDPEAAQAAMTAHIEGVKQRSVTESIKQQ